MLLNLIRILSPLLIITLQGCSLDKGCFRKKNDIIEYIESNEKNFAYLIRTVDTLQNGGIMFSMYKSGKVIFQSNTLEDRSKWKHSELIDHTIAETMQNLNITSIQVDSCYNFQFNFSCYQNPPIQLIKPSDLKNDCLKNKEGILIQGFIVKETL